MSWLHFINTDLARKDHLVIMFTFTAHGIVVLPMLRDIKLEMRCAFWMVLRSVIQPNDMRRSGSMKLGQFLLTTGKRLHLGNSFHVGISLHWHDLMLWLWVILIESSLRANLIALHFVTLFAFILFFNQSYHLGNHVALGARRGNWGSTSSYDLTKIHAKYKKEIKQNPQAVWLQVLHF